MFISVVKLQCLYMDMVILLHCVLLGLFKYFRWTNKRYGRINGRIFCFLKICNWLNYRFIFNSIYLSKKTYSINIEPGTYTEEEINILKDENYCMRLYFTGLYELGVVSSRIVTERKEIKREDCMNEKLCQIQKIPVHLLLLISNWMMIQIKKFQLAYILVKPL